MWSTQVPSKGLKRDRLVGKGKRISSDGPEASPRQVPLDDGGYSPGRECGPNGEEARNGLESAWLMTCYQPLQSLCRDKNIRKPAAGLRDPGCLTLDKPGQ